MLDKNPSLTPQQVYAILAQTADPTVGDPGDDDRTGAGSRVLTIRRRR
jgi:hypothetical protein